MDFKSAERYLLSLANLPRQEYMHNPKKCGVYLERAKFFLKLLGNPEKKIPHYIHVTGTSGKGSVATFLQAILRASGRRAALLTSPHHTKITERWQIDDRQMTEREFAALATEIKPVLDQYLGSSPYDLVSYHELMDIIGFLYFARQGVSWAVLEVGMGGRYCSTNVIPWKDAAVITNIGWDHVELLGPTKTAITREKAGIIKPGCLVFTGEKNKRLLSVIKAECKKRKVKLKVSDSQSSILNCDLDGTEFEYKNERYRILPPGRHQVENAVLCIEVARALRLPEKAIKRGLSSARQPLRMEVVSSRPLIILDGAHNVEKMMTTVETLQHFNTATLQHPTRVHLLIGFSHDKMWPQMIKQLAALNPAAIACTRNTINPFRKVAPPEDLAKICRKLLPTAKVQSFLDPAEALAWSRKRCQKNDILLITGSIFLSGELRPSLTRRR